MKLWFKKQNEEPVAPPQQTAVAQASVAAPSPAAAPQSAMKQVAASPSAASSTVPIRPRMGQKALYYQMMNAIYDAVLILDDNGHVVDCNERVPSILGHSREELWDEPVGLLIPGITPQIFAKMKTSLHGNRRVLISARCHRKDGSSFHGEVGAGLIDLTGENLVLTIRNIEKRSPVKAIVRKGT